MTFDDPLTLYTLAQMAAFIYGQSPERTTQAQRAAVKEAATILRFCEEHLEAAEVLQPDTLNRWEARS
jgi:hypothetical protein